MAACHCKMGYNDVVRGNSKQSKWRHQVIDVGDGRQDALVAWAQPWEPINAFELVSRSVVF